MSDLFCSVYVFVCGGVGTQQIVTRHDEWSRSADSFRCEGLGANSVVFAFLAVVGLGRLVWTWGMAWSSNGVHCFEHCHYCGPGLEHEAVEGVEAEERVTSYLMSFKVSSDCFYAPLMANVHRLFAVDTFFDEPLLRHAHLLPVAHCMNTLGTIINQSSHCFNRLPI